jgi:DUF1680 family protein
LLEVVCRLADHIDSVFGPGEHQLHGYPGHPEIELALMRLYDVTQEPRYLALVNYFVESAERSRIFTISNMRNAAKRPTGIPTARRGW